MIVITIAAVVAAVACASGWISERRRHLESVRLSRIRAERLAGVTRPPGLRLVAGEHFGTEQEEA